MDGGSSSKTKRKKELAAPVNLDAMKFPGQISAKKPRRAASAPADGSMANPIDKTNDNDDDHSSVIEIKEDVKYDPIDIFLNRRPDGNSMVLVYPFGDPDVIECAAKGLPSCTRLVPEGSLEVVGGDQDDNDDDDNESLCSLEPDVGSEKSFEVITLDCVRRICPGAWLNDALINFWMRW